MKEIIINSILIVVSIIVVWASLYFWGKWYGKRSSISAYAKPLRDEGYELLFYIFITLGICVPFVWLGQESYIAIAGGMSLFGIGVITGYNPGLREGKIQHAIHVVLTNIAIGFSIAGLAIINPYLIIVEVLFLIPCLILWIKKVPSHTKKIEILIIIMCWVCFIIERVILLLLK